MKPKIFYINGVALSGKDTFVDMVSYYVPVMKLSTIDEVKRIASESFGWDGVKDEEGRALLSSLKYAWAKHNNGPANAIKNKIEQNKAYVSAIFIMVREYDEMIKMQDMLGGKTINVVRDGSHIGQTEQGFLDLVPYDYKYDVVVKNNGMIDDLRQEAKAFAKYSVLI